MGSTRGATKAEYAHEQNRADGCWSHHVREVTTNGAENSVDSGGTA